MEILKPTQPLKLNGNPIYPKTSSDQIVWEETAAPPLALNSEKLGGKAPQYYLQPRNLLDNSDFRNPVNQRGQTSYTGAIYGIDRWRSWIAGNVITVGDGCITISGEAHFAQYVNNDLFRSGQTYTFAVKKTDGSIEVAHGTYPMVESSIGNGMRFRLYDGASNVTIDGTGDYLWAALYEGSYTAETLPPYVPKGYAVELAECMRYFQNVATQVPNTALTSTTRAYWIPFYVVMRAAPTITIKTFVERNNWDQTTITSEVNSSQAYGCRLYARGETTSSSALWADVRIHASADL